MNALTILKKHEDEIKKGFNVSSIGVFGSFARDEHTPESDVDVLVEFKAGFTTFDNYMGLKYFLEEIFSRKVDLVTVNALRPQLKDGILQEVVYA